MKRRSSIEKYLSPNATFVYNQDFKNAVAKVQNADEAKLTRPEKWAFQDYLLVEAQDDDGEAPDPIEEFYCDAILNDRQTAKPAKKNKAKKYRSKAHFVERLFTLFSASSWHHFIWNWS